MYEIANFVLIKQIKTNLQMALDMWNCEPFNIHQLKNKLRSCLCTYE